MENSIDGNLYLHKGLKKARNGNWKENTKGMVFLLFESLFKKSLSFEAKIVTKD